jgi:hypothetical protein
MNDPDNFFSRWSRRKREDAAANSPAEKSDAQPDDRATPPPDQARQSVPAFDVASLPPIESIGAGTDISAFMQTGVPTVLRHAALRRAWATDPAIRDFVGLNENFWDAAGPDGIRGFGELDPGLDVKRMVSELFGETTPDKPEPEQSESATKPAQSDENLETPNDHGKTADPVSPQSAPQQSENGAPQKKAAPAAQAVQEQPMQKMTRRHGGATPE